MSGQVFRITELNPSLKMELGRLLESQRLGGRFSSGLDLYGIFDSDGSLAGIAGSKEYEPECLLHFVAVKESDRGEGVGTALVSRILSGASARCERVWVLALPGSEGYFERFGFEPAATDTIPGRVRESKELASVEIASTKVMKLRLPETWRTE